MAWGIGHRGEQDSRDVFHSSHVQRSGGSHPSFRTELNLTFHDTVYDRSGVGWFDGDTSDVSALSYVAPTISRIVGPPDAHIVGVESRVDDIGL